MQKIKNIIKDRPCFVVAKGASLEILKERIEMFKDLDICWVSLNSFNYIEDTILSKINKQFELLSNCATVLNVEHYEKTVRIPRMETYLKRPNNLFMTSELVLQECFRDMKRNDLLEQYKDKIVTIDSLFSLPSCLPEVWNQPPNSITLLFAFLIAGGAKKVVIFGLDGYQSSVPGILSYYMPDFIRQERLDAFGDIRDGSIRGDGDDFNIRWKDILTLYKNSFNNPDVQFFNCSSISTITAIPKITYDQIKNII
jgi:hypothetical protein